MDYVVEGPDCGKFRVEGLDADVEGAQEIETGYFGQIVVVVEAAQRIAWVAVFEQGTVVAGD